MKGLGRREEGDSLDLDEVREDEASLFGASPDPPRPHPRHYLECVRLGIQSRSWWVSSEDVRGQ